jgi:hypothetical protein
MSPGRLVVFISFVAGVSLFAGACAPGAPSRPAAYVNPHGISDDISAVTMTQSDRLRPADPNRISTYPKSFETRAP